MWKVRSSDWLPTMKHTEIDNSVLVNGRRQTNLGVFRAYLTSYLKSLPEVNHDLTCMVRQLQHGRWYPVGTLFLFFHYRMGGL